jgi:hypothetical protein
MRRGKKKSGKLGHWTQNQKLQAVSTWLMLGNMAETAIVTGIPLPTLKNWRYTDWFKEMALQLQGEELDKTTASMRKLVDKALKAVEDRLELGDAMFDQKTGKIVRIPVKAQVALKISTELITKQQALQENPQKQEIEKTVDDRLLKLSEEFAKFASKKLHVEQPIDVIAKEL